MDVKLFNPLNLKNFHKDDQILHDAESKRLTIEIPISAILNASFVNRAKLINNLRIFVKKIVKRRTPFVFTLNSKDKYEEKNERELTAIICMLGLTSQQAKMQAQKAIRK